MDNKALFKLGYGLYVLTAKNGDKDNGCITNTVLQVTSSPHITGVLGINKQNFTHDMIMETKEYNLSILTTEAPFDLFKHFGFQSGRTVDKFADYPGVERSENGLIYLPKYSNAYLSFKLTETVDFGSHTLFKSDIVDGKIIGDGESLTYAYYQEHIKQKPQDAVKKGYRCSICGYVYEGEPLPPDFVCPICKHGASYFTKI